MDLDLGGVHARARPARRQDEQADGQEQDRIAFRGKRPPSRPPREDEMTMEILFLAKALLAQGSPSPNQLTLDEQKAGWRLLFDGKTTSGWRGLKKADFYDVLPPARDKPLRPVGEWNQSRILVKGSHVEHWLNGRRVLEYELGSPELKAAIARSKFKGVAGFGTRIKGHILLQDHGDEVCYRSVKILSPPR